MVTHKAAANGRNCEHCGTLLVHQASSYRYRVGEHVALPQGAGPGGSYPVSRLVSCPDTRALKGKKVA